MSVCLHLRLADLGIVFVIWLGIHTDVSIRFIRVYLIYNVILLTCEINSLFDKAENLTVFQNDLSGNLYFELFIDN